MPINKANGEMKTRHLSALSSWTMLWQVHTTNKMPDRSVLVLRCRRIQANPNFEDQGLIRTLWTVNIEFIYTTIASEVHCNRRYRSLQSTKLDNGTASKRSRALGVTRVLSDKRKREWKTTQTEICKSLDTKQIAKKQLLWELTFEKRLSHNLFSNRRKAQLSNNQ